MRVGIAADHGGFTLKGQVAESLRASGYEVADFGAHQLNPADDYPDFIIPLARAVAAGRSRARRGPLWQRRRSFHRGEQDCRRSRRAHP